MNELLTQVEIDELLTDDNIDVNSFKSQFTQEVNSEDIKLLQEMHESLGYILSEKLTDLLNREVDIKLIQIRKYSGSLKKIMNEPSVLTGCFKLNSSHGIYTLNVELVYSVLESLFGGNGKSGYYSLELTDIEKNIFDIIKDIIVKCIHIELEQYQTKIDIVKVDCNRSIVVSKIDIIFVIMNVRLSDGRDGQLKLYYPLRSLLP